MTGFLNKRIKKIQDESAKIKKEARTLMVSYIAAAFGLVAGLAWNDAIKSLIEHLYPLSRTTLLAKFAYAFLITGAVVIVTIYLVRLFKKEESSSK